MICGRQRLFIYYRLTPGDTAATLRLLIQAQHALMGRIAGLDAALMRRPSAPGSPVTLMETYTIDARIDPDGVSPQTQLLIEQTFSALLGSKLDGQRHVEVFEACV